MIVKWSNLPAEQHIPLNTSMTSYALKVTLTVLFGDQFSNDAEVLSFKKNYDDVSMFLLTALFWLDCVESSSWIYKITITYSMAYHINVILHFTVLSGSLYSISYIDCFIKKWRNLHRFILQTH